MMDPITLIAGDRWLISPRQLRRLASWWRRHPRPHDALVLAACGEDRAVIRSVHRGRRPIIFLASFRALNEELHAWGRALRGAGLDCQGWRGVDADLLDVIAEEADRGARVLLDAPMQPTQHIEISVGAWKRSER